MRNLWSWLLFGVGLSLLIAGTYTGYTTYVWENDKTYLSFLTLGFAIYAYIWGFYSPGMLDTAQGMCQRFGIIGTCLGFMIMTSGLSDVNAYWSEVTAGISTAILTTLVGMVCSTWLRMHGWLMGMGD